MCHVLLPTHMRYLPKGAMNGASQSYVHSYPRTSGISRYAIQLYLLFCDLDALYLWDASSMIPFHH